MGEKALFVAVSTVDSWGQYSLCWWVHHCHSQWLSKKSHIPILACLMASINSRKLPTFFKLNILEVRVRKNSFYLWLQQYPTFPDSPVWLCDSIAVQILWLGKIALVVQESKYLSTWCSSVLPQDQHPKPQDGRKWERIKFDVVLKERKNQTHM